MLLNDVEGVLLRKKPREPEVRHTSTLLSFSLNFLSLSLSCLSFCLSLAAVFGVFQVGVVSCPTHRAPVSFWTAIRDRKDYNFNVSHFAGGDPTERLSKARATEVKGLGLGMRRQGDVHHLEHLGLKLVEDAERVRSCWTVTTCPPAWLS